MKYVWIFLLFSAVALGQNAYGPDFLNLHCTTPDLNSVPTFGVAPKPGFAPNGSTNGSATIYCDGPSGTIKASFNSGPFITLGSNSTYFGSCQGTAASAATVGVFPLGGSTALTCVALDANMGVPVSHNCSLKNLQVISSSAGVNASDGLTTIQLAGSGTAVTCTIGTGTSCSDTTHTVAATAGQKLRVTVVTQTSSTLANLGISFDCQ